MLTIPKKVVGRDDLVIIPRKWYQELISQAKKTDWLSEKPIAKELRKRIALAEKELKRGKLIAWSK